MKTCTKGKPYKSGNKTNKKPRQKSCDNRETPKGLYLSLISKLNKESAKDKRN